MGTIDVASVKERIGRAQALLEALDMCIFHIKKFILFPEFTLFH